LVNDLKGSPQAKARLRALLETLSGQQTIRQACRALGISARRLEVLRRGLLQEVLGRLEPRPAGRPPRPAASADARTATLEGEVHRLRLELHAARIREEIALALPHVLTRSRRTKKGQRKDAPARRSNAGRPGT
jgi:hypothetical protein